MSHLPEDPCTCGRAGAWGFVSVERQRERGAHHAHGCPLFEPIVRIPRPRESTLAAIERDRELEPEQLEPVSAPTIAPGETYRVVFRAKRRGYAEALTGLRAPLELRWGASGTVYVLPDGCAIRSLGSAITLWPARIDPAFDLAFDVHNAGAEPAPLDTLRVISSPQGSHCPTCSAPLVRR